MAPEQPPARLKNDASTSEQLRSMLEQAHRDLPNAATLASLGNRVEATIAAGVAGSAVTGGGLLGGKASGVAAGIAAGALVIAGIWLGARNNEHLLNNAASQSSGPLEHEAAPQALQSLASAAPTAAQDGNTAEPAAKGEPPSTRSRAATGATSSTATLPSEASLLHEARSKLLAEPARALQLTSEHARRFPNGALSQEREVIAIEALRRLGRADAAQQRGAAFQQQFPQSAHRSKVEQSLKGAAK